MSGWAAFPALRSRPGAPPVCWSRILPVVAENNAADRDVSWEQTRLLQLPDNLEAALSGYDAVAAVRPLADHDDAVLSLGRCRGLQLAQGYQLHFFRPASVAHATEDAPSARRGGKAQGQGTGRGIAQPFACEGAKRSGALQAAHAAETWETRCPGGRQAAHPCAEGGWPPQPSRVRGIIDLYSVFCTSAGQTSRRLGEQRNRICAPADSLPAFKPLAMLGSLGGGRAASLACAARLRPACPRSGDRNMRS